MGRIKFTVNGEQHSVGSEVSSDVTLVDYLRNTLELRGTKYMCREAGCGACIVSAVKYTSAPVQAVNSCMVSITSCQGWDITTIEGLGNRKKGYHILQKTLAKFNGTQCGYCTPAWIMTMHSLLESKKKLTMTEIEQSFGGNVCRCTGYRPILEAFKMFGTDAEIPDIEELKLCKNTGISCVEKDCDESDWCLLSTADLARDKVIDIKLKDNKHWFRAVEVEDIFCILRNEGNDSYMLMFGNTARGAYPIEEYPRILIDISGVSELKGYRFDQNLIIGASTSLTELMEIFENEAKSEYFAYLEKLHEHLKSVAHIPVRNLGSIAGNLITKHKHPGFSSDLFLLFETIGAQLTIQTKNREKKNYTMQEFLKIDMRGRVILNVLLPPLGKDYSIVTFKIMPRSQNAHAIVNAGFLYKLRKNIVKKSRIVFGGLSPSFYRATATEKYLEGKNLFSNETLQLGLNILKKEIIVTESPPQPTAEYRKQLALGLFYKGLLSLSPEITLNPRYRSGATKIHRIRPLSKATEDFQTHSDLWPLNQPIPRLEGLIQCAGEAFYTDDTPTFSNEVYAAFALSTVAVGDIVSIDATEAMKYPGVIAFYTAKDIPGLNSFTPDDFLFYTANEELICSKSVKYYNQVIGIVVAESRHVADVAAKKVRAVYKNVRKPVIDVQEAIKDPNRISLLTSIDATVRGDDISRVIKGFSTTYWQYHFCMETLVCVTYPTEEGLKVYTASHWIDMVQVAIARVLNWDTNRIDVHIRRLGGSYGIKVSRANQGAAACSLVSYKLNRPCRFVQSLPTNLRAVGKRFPCNGVFETGVSSSGEIQYIDYNVYQDNGYMINEQLTSLGTTVYNNCYNKARWNYKAYDALTDTPKNTWCRSPCTLEQIGITETLMEQIAYEMSLDPLAVRLANLDYDNYSDLKEMIDTVIENSEYLSRRDLVNKFNIENRWKKRGLRFSLLKWSPLSAGSLGVTLSVYHGDGTVAISHGGIEMGQGINTKAVQICAYLLKIPIGKIVIKENNTIIGPNNIGTGGSFTYHYVNLGVRRCCEELLKRLEPIRSQMTNPTWEEIITKAFSDGVDLQTHGFVNATDPINTYNIFGVTLAEVEVDVLTGELEVRRVDILQDVGQSVNPFIDMGQTEGAFIMGLGFWTSENIIYDKNTGEILTDRTWDYFVPQALDIPQDFRVSLRKNSYSLELIFGSKSISEPPMCMSVAVALAIREAIVSARVDSGIPATEWFPSVGPFTVEKICLMSSNKTEDFKFN